MGKGGFTRYKLTEDGIVWLNADQCPQGRLMREFGVVTDVQSFG